MASKFQNRLVGTIVLVALGVIILPGILDGKKKHYREEFETIPLIPGSHDQQESEVIPSATQPLPVSPPEGAGPAVEGKSQHQSQAVDSGSVIPQQNSEPSVVAPPPPEQPGSDVSSPPASKPLSEKLSDEQKKVSESGQKTRYVVQLGALKNSAKVSEIVAQLRLSGYPVYTVPAKPVQGSLTRIYVGPESNKSKLQSSLSELQSVTGLSGVVRTYQP